MKLQNKTAIITGAGSGISEAIAKKYLEEGANCVLVDLKNVEEKFAPLKEQYKNKIVTVTADISQDEEIEKIVATTLKSFGEVNILLNGAGIYGMRPLLEDSMDDFKRLFAVNVQGSFVMLQAVARQMVKQGKGGKIINLSSQAGRRGEALSAHYCATKASIISYTQSAALALAEHQINVNAIAPGVVDTPMWDQVDALFAKYENLPLGEKKRQVGKAVPWGRMGKVSDFAGPALFLASEDSDYITGQTLNVDGGNCMN